MTAEFPSKLRPLFSPYRIKDIRGGRDAGKSWGVAQALVTIASSSEQERKDWGLWVPDNQSSDGVDRGIERIVCCRENMNSIADSVYQLLEDTLHRLQLESMWRVEKQGWKNHRTGAEFIFRGLRNPDALKSLEGASRAWIEEAQSMSAASWRKIPPTVRRKNSELWFTWNPELETDPTYQELVVNPDPGTVHILLNYVDNPWPSEVLDAKREKMRLEDPDEFTHVYMGQPRRSLAGAIYANEIRLAESQGRIGQYPYNPSLPVDTGWDLGDSDLCCIWFFQRSMGQYRAIDYEEDSHKPLSHYLSLMEAKPYTYGKDYFPWDASSKMLIGSLEETMRQRGRSVTVMPRQPRAAGIDATREMLGTCWFNQATTADGLNRLRYYRQAMTKIVDPVTGDPVMSMQPIHDQNCFHPHTLVLTRYGTRRIMDIGQNEEVLTPCGFKPAQRAKVTRRNAQLVEVKFTDGLTVRCTPDHTFLTDKGWRFAAHLTSTSQILSPWTPLMCTSAAGYTGCGRESDIFRGLEGVFTEMCGLLRLATSRLGATFTTETPIASTTVLTISNASRSQSIHGRLLQSAVTLLQARWPERTHASGTNPKKGGYGISVTPRNPKAGSISREKKGRVRIAASRLRHWFGRVAESLSGSVPTHARPLRIAHVRPLPESVDTWCIDVPDGHWFCLANGAVVHNSHGADALRTIAMGYKRPPKAVAKPLQKQRRPLSAWS